MANKARVLELLERGYSAEAALVAGLPDEERSNPGTWGRWSVRDTVAHNAAWKAHIADGLAAVSEGREPTSTDDYEHHNEVIFGEYHSKPWSEIEAFAEQAHRSLVRQVGLLNDEELDSLELLPWRGDRPLWRVALGTGFNHPLIHISDYYKQRGDIEQAAEVISELATAVVDLDDSPDWQGLVKYNLACRHSLLGEKGPAIDRLRQALDLNRGLLDWSKEDPDLEAIRGEPACRALYESHAHPDA